MKIPSLTQLQTSLEQVNNNTKNYIRSIQETAEGLQFLDGNGNVVYSLTTFQKQSPNLTLDKYLLTLTRNTNETITANFEGDGTLSVTPDSNNYYYYLESLNSNQIVISRVRDYTSESITETFVVTLSETDLYESATATISCVEASQGKE